MASFEQRFPSMLTNTSHLRLSEKYLTGCFSISSKASPEPLFQAYYVIECSRSTVPMSSILGNLPSPAYFVWRNVEAAHV